MILKLIFFIILYSLLTNCTESHQKSPSLTPDKSNHDTASNTEYLAEKLIPIRTYVAHIDSINEWSLVLPKDLDQTPMKGKVTFFVWNNEILKIITNQSNKNSNKSSRYYIKNRQLIFVHEKIMDLKNETELETESYYENEKLIRSLDNQDCGAPYNDEYHLMEQKRIEMDMKKLMKLYIK